MSSLLGAYYLLGECNTLWGEPEHAMAHCTGAAAYSDMPWMSLKVYGARVHVHRFRDINWGVRFCTAFTVDSVESGVWFSTAGGIGKKRSIQAFQKHAVLDLMFCACSVSVLFIVQFQLRGELSRILFYVLVSPPLFAELFEKYFENTSPPCSLY